MTTLRVVDRSTPATILWDFDDAAGTNNPSGVQTRLRDLDIGPAAQPFDIVKGRGAVTGHRVLADPQLRRIIARVDVTAPDGSIRTLTSGVGELYRLLSSDAAADRLIAWDDGDGVRFFDPLGIESALPNLRMDSFQVAVVNQGRDISLEVEVLCQPYVLGDELDSDDNLLSNATLCAEGATAGRPTAWAWDSTTNITAEDIDPVEAAYAFTIATTGTRNLQQTSAAGTFAPSDVAAFSFYAKASADSIADARAVVRYADSGGTPLGTETAGTLIGLTTSWQRITVVGAAAPASTSRALASIRFQNGSASSVEVFIRDAQLEADAVTTFRVGTETITNDPSDPLGRAFEVVVAGDAPTPVIFDLTAGASAKLVAVRMADRWDNGSDGTNRLTDYLNETKWAPGAANGNGWTVSLGGSTSSTADADAVTGNAAEVTIGTGLIGVRLRRWRAVRTNKLNSLRGEWLVVGRIKTMTRAEWVVQLRSGPSNSDPVPDAEPAVTVSIDESNPGYEDVPLGYLRVPETGAIGAVALELWIARMSGNADSASLRISDVFLVPRSPQSWVYVPGGGKTKWNGEEFITPPTEITGDPTFAAGERTSGGGIRLDANGEAMGVRPNTGIAFGTTREQITFEITRADLPHAGMVVRVVNITDDTVVRERDIVKARDYQIAFDAVSGKSYQPQVVHRAGTGRKLTCSRIVREYVPVVGSGERLVVDPERLEVARYDATGNILGDAAVKGQTPFVLDPGRHVIVAVPGDAPLDGHALEDSDVDRTLTVRTRYTPRWTQ